MRESSNGNCNGIIHLTLGSASGTSGKVSTLF